jgi:hypothetical protein
MSEVDPSDCDLTEFLKSRQIENFGPHAKYPIPSSPKF